MAYFSAKHLGEGQYYLMTIVDKDGKALTAADLPPARPAQRAGQALLVRDGLRPRDARADPRHAAVEPRPTRRGCRRTPTDRWTSTSALKRRRGANQLGPDQRRGQFEVLFRLYGPEKPFFDKVWKLPDIEKMK